MALDNQYPAETYCASSRSYPEVIAPPEYSDAMAIRKVGYNGTITYNNRRLRVHNLLNKAYVGIYQAEEEDEIDIMYYTTVIRTVDLRDVSRRS